MPRILVDHVLFNLLKNALYYVQKHGSGSITVSIDVYPSPRYSGMIRVHDDGPGISPSIIDRIFDRFFTTTAVGRGAGIGLNFCKMVMEEIGGTIRVDSVEGEYTEFTLGFPDGPRPEVDPDLKRDPIN